MSKRFLCGGVMWVVKTVLICFCLVLTGCTLDQPGSIDRAKDRQNQAIRDPYSIGPDLSNLKNSKTDDRYDVSGGDTRNLDRDGIKRDLDAVFNP